MTMLMSYFDIAAALLLASCGTTLPATVSTAPPPT
ncbi:MAG: hypothetical protein JWR77_1080, partial [Rhizorhabdus sp.]|nr:hypothetical protein [Rhizorhabdus sp.]